MKKYVGHVESVSTGKEKIIIVMPAYNAERTLRKTFDKIPADLVEEIILVDDASTDNTAEIARSLGMTVIRHERNRGYGANQKTCFNNALKRKNSLIAVIHPDFQYDPSILEYAVGFINLGICDVILGSRIRSRKETLRGGMPFYKYIANRMLTTMENIVFDQNIGDFHTGFRIFHRKVLETIQYNLNSDDFIFDTQILAQLIYRGYTLGDVPIPTLYDKDSSSIGLGPSIRYGTLTLVVLAQYILKRIGIARIKIFE